MAMFINRKVKVKFAGDDDYRPRDMPANKFIPAIGFSTRRIEKNVEGKHRIDEELYFIIIDNQGKAVPVAAFNCVAVCDEADDTAKLAETLRNATLLLKHLSEVVAKTDKKEPNNEGEKTG